MKLKRFFTFENTSTSVLSSFIHDIESILPLGSSIRYSSEKNIQGTEFIIEDFIIRNIDYKGINTNALITIDISKSNIDHIKDFIIQSELNWTYFDTTKGHFDNYNVSRDYSSIVINEIYNYIDENIDITNDDIIEYFNIDMSQNNYPITYNEIGAMCGKLSFALMNKKPFYNYTSDSFKRLALDKTSSDNFEIIDDYNNLYFNEVKRVLKDNLNFINEALYIETGFILTEIDNEYFFTIKDILVDLNPNNDKTISYWREKVIDNSMISYTKYKQLDLNSKIDLKGIEDILKIKYDLV